MKVRSLQELSSIGRHLAEQHARQAREEAAQREAERRAQAERELFARAVGPVQPIPQRRKAHLAPPPAEPVPLQRQLDEQRVLREALSDEFDVSTLLDVDDALSFRRPGVGPEITRRLRAGQWSIQREIDLHGLRSDEAREALGQFVRQSHRQGLRCVRVVHGKGLGSPGRMPVLKNKVHSWLVQKNAVMAFVQARPADGGAGALVVLLRPAMRAAAMHD